MIYYLIVICSIKIMLHLEEEEAEKKTSQN